MKMKKIFFVISFFLFINIFSAEKSSAQCAMCKQAAESTLEHQSDSMARSLNSGIVYLMIIPYLLIAFIFRKPLWNFLRRSIGKRPIPSDSDQSL